MPGETVYIGQTPCAARPERPAMEFTDVAGERWVALSDVDAMPPFFMSIVGASDMWLFAGSNGPFTAGRSEPDRAIFPYQTADKIIRGDGASGALTVMIVRRDGRAHLWEPWRGDGAPYRIRRRLLKHVLGAGVLFEETNADLSLRFRWELATCEPYGLIRRCTLENLADRPVSVRCLDGWRHMIAPGVTQETYARLSYLAAGYMRHERIPCGSAALGVYTLNAAIADRAEPVESLRAGAAWAIGPDTSTVLLTERQVGAFRRGEAVTNEDEARGQFGALLVAMELEPGAEESIAWLFGADTWLDPPAVVALRKALSQPDAVRADVARALADDRERLRTLIGGADGLQTTADAAACAHHAANVVFNCMRGGTFDDGGRFPGSDLAAYVRQRNRLVADEHAGWLSSLPPVLSLSDLRSGALALPEHAHLRRIVGEYLPVTFSRRHGDPSRPWNHFVIRLKDDEGRPVRTYQGNWRDIFQNWEALAQSFPDALEPMIATFLSASTADGYNPYRITREGVDWEVANPGDVWGHYGYWGDHQIVYLLRLLEAMDRWRPGLLAAALRERRFAYAHVPYRIVGLDAMLRDPRHTIAFDHDLHARLMARASAIGADGKLLAGDDGLPVMATLAEKLLVPLLAKLTNLVPGGGIWLNTQRPEWNDANNALAGWGLSVVTACYMRRYMGWLRELLMSAGDEPAPVSCAVAEFLQSVTAALASCPSEAVRDPRARMSALRALGTAGERYRDRVYDEGLRGQTDVPIGAMLALIEAALPAVSETIAANRREDGLWHSYNILEVADDCAHVRRLPLMLEGQVAALSSGQLTADEALRLCAALRASDLYRPDQSSYLLYPDRALPSYLAKNTLPDAAPASAPILAELVRSGDGTLVVADAEGRLHFNADLRNASDVVERLDALAARPAWTEAVARDRDAVLGLWEEVFRHSEFTGRSGSFFMFEGLGSIYWHMVAKLLVAVQECFLQANASGAPDVTVRGLAEAYRAIRDGLGYRKPPDVFGAFPTDPYSHSPRHAGAQQPGMTGQVKEEILTRWGELGVIVCDGLIRFEPKLLDGGEFEPEPRTFAFINAEGAPDVCKLPPHSLGFTCCGTPIRYVLGESPGIVVERADGSTRQADCAELTAEESADVLGRTGSVRGITVTVAL
ncbi:MAG: hypothetical protein GX446_05905 [Chthonomonadales bacterium]|nr:hypothetical protein [Chthonomonadales bacterium]